MYAHPAMLRGGLGLNAASTWDTCLPRDYRWFILPVQRMFWMGFWDVIHESWSSAFCYWISLNKDVSHFARLGASEWRGMHQFDLEKTNLFPLCAARPAAQRLIFLWIGRSVWHCIQLQICPLWLTFRWTDQAASRLSSAGANRVPSVSQMSAGGWLFNFRPPLC